MAEPPAENNPKPSPLLRTKPIATILEECREKENGLKRVLSAFDLTAIGIGAVIGAGIFVLTGTAAREAAGPGIMLSYTFAGIACILAAFCYAEFAARLPISGSAYTYAYASVGELAAWIIGWDLILEYTIGGSTVAVGWVHYLEEFFKGFHINFPPWLLHLQVGAIQINIMAAVVISLLCVLLCVGVKESAKFNAIMVSIKLLVVLFVIFAGIPWVQPENWTPFLPHGIPSIFQGAALIFFAYIGFDAVSTAAEEVKNPQRDLPIGIIASLVLCTILYVAVSAVITGMVPYQNIDPGAPLAAAFGSVGNVMAQKLISLGGVVGLLTVMLILLMSQSRIYFSMARDGLLWPWFSSIHPTFRTPVNATVIACGVAAIMAAFVPMEDLHHMVSIGTLFAFVVVSGSVLIARYQLPEKPTQITPAVLWLGLGLVLLCFGASESVIHPIEIKLLQSHWLIEEAFQTPIRLLSAGLGLIISVIQCVSISRMPVLSKPVTFCCPGVPWVPIIAMGANIYMMVNLSLEAWIRLFLWLGVGLVIYFSYSKQHSRLQ